MVGLPDGLGAFDNGDGTFTLLANHEAGSTNGIPRAHGAAGLVNLAGGITFHGGAGNDSLVFRGAAVTSSVYNVGPTADAGNILHTTDSDTQRVSFTGLEPVIDLMAGPLTINADNANNAISYTAGANSGTLLVGGAITGQVGIDSFETYEFANKTALTINALGGSDTIVVRTPAPNNAVWDVDVTIDGGSPSAGDPSGSDRLVVETPGAGAETSIYTPSAADAGTLDLTTLSSLISMVQIEELLYDGEADNDGLTVVGTGGADSITHTPGSTDQAGTFRVNGLLPISYENLGAGGALSADGGAGSDTLIYLGTNGNDTFLVPNAGGDIALNSRLVVTTDDVETLTMEGLLGDDLFDLAPPVPDLVYGQVNANGGGEASATGDRTVVRTTGADEDIGISGQVLTVGSETLRDRYRDQFENNCRETMGRPCPDLRVTVVDTQTVGPYVMVKQVARIRKDLPPQELVVIYEVIYGKIRRAWFIRP